MPNLISSLRQEIRRLAKKECNAAVSSLKSANAQYRRDIAALKRENADLLRRVSFLEKQEKRRLGDEPQPPKDMQVRFSPAWLKGHREKLGLSADDYARLVGVSSLSIYNWENEKTTPREAQKAKLAAVRSLGKREALKRLEMMGE